MASDETVYISLAPGEPRGGIWCDRCQTSAGYEVDVYILGEDGPYITSTAGGCLRCDGWED